MPCSCAYQYVKVFDRQAVAYQMLTNFRIIGYCFGNCYGTDVVFEIVYFVKMSFYAFAMERTKQQPGVCYFANTQILGINLCNFFINTVSLFEIFDADICIKNIFVYNQSKL